MLRVPPLFHDSKVAASRDYVTGVAITDSMAAATAAVAVAAVNVDMESEDGRVSLGRVLPSYIFHL